ncbi:hypothetical protein LINPERHAP2_LOCUS13095 [Linum perenne]
MEDDALASDESDDDGEDDLECPTVRIPSHEARRVRTKWSHSLILRTLGKSFPYEFMVRKLNQLWARKGKIWIWDIGFGHYVAKFMSVEDYDRAMFEGPWLVGDHYVVSEEWRPNFEPGYAQVNNIRVWIRLPNLPIEYFDAAILSLIGDKVGRTVRIDNTTLSGTRGNYARLCVEIDLHRPLLSKYRLRRRVRRIEYEGLHTICFHCGCYGHSLHSCPILNLQEHTEDQTNPTPPAGFPMQDDDIRPEVVEDYGPWMLAKKRNRTKSMPSPNASPKQGSEHLNSKGGSGSRFSSLQEDNIEPTDHGNNTGGIEIEQDANQGRAPLPPNATKTVHQHDKGVRHGEAPIPNKKHAFGGVQILQRDNTKTKRSNIGTGGKATDVGKTQTDRPIKANPKDKGCSAAKGYKPNLSAPPPPNSSKFQSKDSPTVPRKGSSHGADDIGGQPATGSLMDPSS